MYRISTDDCQASHESAASGPVYTDSIVEFPGRGYLEAVKMVGSGVLSIAARLAERANFPGVAKTLDGIIMPWTRE